MSQGIVAGVDVGGTFTDLVLFDPAAGTVRLAKTPTTPDNQAFGVLAALEAAGDTTRTKSITLGVWLPDMMMKAALLSANPNVFFTTPHFDGHPSVLVSLSRIDVSALRLLISDAWLGRAPKRLAAEFTNPSSSPKKKKTKKRTTKTRTKKKKRTKKR